MTLDFQLFGPLLVRRDGQPIVLGGEIPQAILGRLAQDAGELVDTETLLSDIWEVPGDGALSSLRAYLSRLRAAGLEGWIQGSRSGYALEVPPEAVDLLRFRSSAADLPRLGTGDEALAAAEHLVRISAREPFEELRAPFVAAARFRYREERRGVLERLGELLLQRGDITAAVLAMEDAVVEHPYDEKPTRLLALALARSGRRSDALEAIDAFGRRIAAWRGLETPTRLLELRQAIVRHDPNVLGRATRSVVRTGVPHPLTRFIGRRDELGRVAEARQTGRLVTLVGPGGVGKTRLAIELARAATTDDEQWFVDLAAVGDPDRVLPAVADTLGAVAPTLEAVAARLAERSTLIVLDNAEHVIGAAAAVASGILSRAETVSLLVTSREPLRLPGERIVHVTPLTLEDARAVFLERAADATGGRVDEAVELVDEIVDSLDAIPLALELTAARLDVLSGRELLDAVRTGGGFDERGSGAGRHDSVVNAVRWSVDLLTGSQRDLLIQLGRFAGGFTEEAVLGICDSEDDPAVLLARLVDKSLVSVSHGDAGLRRYRLLDTVRHYVNSLDEPDEEWWDAHRRWLADFATDQGPRTRTHDARVANALLDVLSADLRVALDNAVAAGDRVGAVRIAGPQAHHWFTRGLMAEGIRNIERALAVPGDLPPLLEADTMLHLTVLLYQSGNAERAFQTIGRAFECGVAAGDAAIPSVALARTAYGRSLFGQVDEARQLMAQAAELSGSAPDWARAEVLMCRGQTLRALGEGDEALASLDESIELATRVGYGWMMASASYVAGKVLTDQRRGREAIAELRRAAARALAAEDPTGTLANLHQIGGACALVERHEEGARVFGAIDRIGARYGYNPVVAEGEETRALRDRVAAGLTPNDYARAYRDGSVLEFADLFELVETLPQRDRADASVLA